MLSRLLGRGRRGDVRANGDAHDLLAAARAERARRRAGLDETKAVSSTPPPVRAAESARASAPAAQAAAQAPARADTALALRGGALPARVEVPGPPERAGDRELWSGETISARELIDDVDPKVLAFLSAQFAREMKLLPFRLEGGELWVATARPLSLQQSEQTRWIVSLCGVPVTVRFARADASVLERAIEAHYPELRTTGLTLTTLGEMASMFGPAARHDVAALGGDALDSTRGLVEHLLCLAVERRASDVLIDTWETDVVVRLKVDGSCETVISGLPAHAGPQVISVIKQMARLKIFETEQQQSGGYEATVQYGDCPRRVEFRVEVTPTIYGESCSIRLHDSTNRRVDLDQIGADERTKGALRRFVSTRRGMLVLSGPTESGKTTTLYAVLGEVDLARENVVAIEDPVEIRVRGVRPIQVNEARGVTFASSLRSILRQNPDRILVGEIRDRETANLAVFAALTGHQVLTTVHADDAPRTVVRMLREGIEPHNLATILDGVIAQRLLGRNCQLCAEPVVYDPELLLAAGYMPWEVEEVHARRSVGCKVCRWTGIEGRAAVHETLWVTPEMREAIERLGAATERELRRLGAESGMRTLRRAGLDLVREGVVSLEQVLMMTPHEGGTLR